MKQSKVRHWQTAKSYFTDVHTVHIQRSFKSGVIQVKFKIGQPRDIYEQRADRVKGRF